MRSDEGPVGKAEEEQEIVPQLGRARVELVTKEEERNVRVFVHAGEEVDAIIRGSSGGVLELEDSDDNSTNSEGHAQGPEHEAIHPAL